MKKLALVIGGAACVWNDAVAALILATPDAVLVINDMIPRWPCPIDHAVSLHPVKLPDWLAARHAAGFDPPEKVWAHRTGPGVTHTTEDWQGSSGLFAVKIALEQGYRGVLLAGVPIDRRQPHFLRARPWSSAPAFLKGWRLHRDLYEKQTRSMSGWTLSELGRPTAAWLEAIDARLPSPALVERIRIAQEGCR